MPGILNIVNRVAVVIGATSGIGRTLALGLADHGAIVVPSGRRADRVAEVAGEIEQKGFQTMVHAVDAGSAATARRANPAPRVGCCPRASSHAVGVPGGR